MDLINYQTTYRELFTLLDKFGLNALSKALPLLLEKGLSRQRYADINRWQEALNQLPKLDIASVKLDVDTITVNSKVELASEEKSQLVSALKGLHPWRKGPFNLAGVDIDTEWRSDFKWQRLVQSISPLVGRKVLDVGCGSGYHCWRMAGEGASLVVGIDPTPLFVMQFWALQKYINDARAWVVPARMEQLPEKMAAFDTVFSMGVLYHRRSPFGHLQELKDALRDGGELVLETLVIEGDEHDVLVPEGRYAKMGNVWFIPSVSMLCLWLKKLKFKDIHVVDVSQTTIEEQRATKWMQFESLVDFLDPIDQTKTIEGYPGPRRAIVVAKK